MTQNKPKGTKRRPKLTQKVTQNEPKRPPKKRKQPKQTKTTRKEPKLPKTGQNNPKGDLS